MSRYSHVVARHCETLPQLDMCVVATVFFVCLNNWIGGVKIGVITDSVQIKDTLTRDNYVAR